MGGELAWTGTDGGQLSGSWGTSVIDLGDLADKGDTVSFRFDIGRDGCNGVDGWYLDNLVVQTCAKNPVQPDQRRGRSGTRERGRPFTVKVKVTSDGATPVVAS